MALLLQLVELLELLQLNDEEFEDVIDWLRENKIETSELISRLRKMLMEEIAK